MLKDLHIQNYRLFEDFKMKGLGQVNLIAGKNNTGKTALLEALRILESKGDLSVISNIILERGDLNRHDSESFSTLFTRKLIHINRDASQLTIELGDTIKLSREVKESDYPTYFSIVERGNGSPVRNNLKTPTDGQYPNDKAVYIPFSNDKIRISDFWKKVVLTPLEDQVHEIMRVIEPKIIRLDIVDNNAKVRLENEINPIPLKNLGEGANRMLIIALALVSSKNKMLLIDEFESGLHYSVQEQLWNIIFEYAKKWNIQVFATTHSMDAVKSFFYVLEKEQNEGMGKFFRLQRSRKGQIESIKYDEKDLELAIGVKLDPR